MAAGRDVPFETGQQELSYIRLHALSLGLDPGAVLAVASHEGGSLPAAVGDSGTSFGPWQLHAGGALPPAVWARGAAYSQQWADSPDGLDYALNAIAGVAKGERGAAAITDIVYRFERPKDPATEVRRSIETYNAGGLPRVSGGGGGGVVGSVVGAVKDLPGVYKAGVNDVTGGVTGAVSDAVGGITGWVERGGKIVLGAGLVLLGLYLIARSFNAVPSVGQVASVLPVGRAASAGKGKGASGPRRQGDAAAARGEPVTQAGQPQPHTAREARQFNRGQGREQKAAGAKRERELAAFGDVPF